MSKTIGMVGGGQLGRMLGEPAIKMGYRVVVVDPNPECPAKQIGAEQIVGGYRDGESILKLGEISDCLTIEIEHTDIEALAAIAKAKPVNPSPATIKLIQDKFNQKQFLEANSLPTADFIEIKSKEEALAAFQKWDRRMIIKSKTEAFDGRGNALIENESEIDEVIERFISQGIYGEKLVDFKKELAVMVAKDKDGNLLSYPVVETVHERNICVEVYAPAQINQQIAEKARQIAEKVVKKLEGAGMYGVEMFLDGNGEILINEIAPRVHNSGHYTMDMFEPSQFKQHILAITGQKLQKPEQKAKYCCMVNILGERNGPIEMQGVKEAGEIPGVSIYLYGKSPTKIDRKMGHINATGDTIEEAKDKARQARKLISI